MQIKENIKSTKKPKFEILTMLSCIGRSGLLWLDRKSTTKYNCKTKISSTPLILTTEVHKHIYTSQSELKQARENNWHLDHKVLGSYLPGLKSTTEKKHWAHKVWRTNQVCSWFRHSCIYLMVCRHSALLPRFALGSIRSSLHRQDGWWVKQI